MGNSFFSYGLHFSSFLDLDAAIEAEQKALDKAELQLKSTRERRNQLLFELKKKREALMSELDKSWLKIVIIFKKT